ncbi:GTPase [Thalassoroseus pseudoceratinae]|uniref:GTPase n=1 Tax=Thalassoroseus pseudoceratinae TaxID=2713176 RepID=UPI0014246D76|nr:GTPase [Thalassoroseus pseudoceratinae]
MNETTIAGVLTPGGRGAVATIMATGNLAHGIDDFFTAANGRRLTDQVLNRVVFGQWGDDPAEDVVVCRVSEEVCRISEEQVEISCHGGDAATRRILSDLNSVGMETAPPSKLLARTQSPFEADWTLATSRAVTTKTLRILLQQRCVFPKAIQSIIEMFSDGSHEAAQQSLREILEWGRFGQHLNQPWEVVLCGRPNVGKSSLINALLGFQRAIVFDQPGTTRDVVRGETAIDGWPMRFADTAGIRETAESLESAGIERTRQMLAKADLRLIVCDLSEPLDADTDQLLREFPDALHVANKFDLPTQWPADRLAGMHLVSSATRQGLPGLVEAIGQRLVPIVPNDDQAIPISPRQIETLQIAHDSPPETAVEILNSLVTPER